MLKIGIDKTDKSFRHFEYDDERMYGNPQKYKVLYEESGDFGEILCSNVLSIKKSTNTRNNFLDIPVYKDKKEDVFESEPISVVEENNEDDTSQYKLIDVVEEIAKSITEEITEEIEPELPKEKKKTKTSKSKIKVKKEEEEVKETIVVPEQHNPVIIPSLPKSYEYDIIVIDNISYVDDIKHKVVDDIKLKLNEMGKDGWELCGFQIVQKVFVSQAIIIMKKGVN